MAKPSSYTEELAKELKEAGFPQKPERLQTFVNNYTRSTPLNGDDWLAVPTLAELIEECGEQFGELYRFPDSWLAESYSNDDHSEGSGDTPEEAVARLWLSMNK